MTDTPPIPVIQAEELKPCPFCGSVEISCEPDFAEFDEKPRWSVICEDCLAESVRSTIEAEARAAWNTRHRIAAIEPLVEALQGAETALSVAHGDFHVIKRQGVAIAHCDLARANIEQALSNIRAALAKIGGAS